MATVREAAGEQDDEEASLAAAHDWWFAVDSTALFLVDEGGRLIRANRAGEKALEEGRLAKNGGEVLKFGSAECDAALLAAVRAVSGREDRRRVVLRQRHGGWFGAGVYGSASHPAVMVALKEELVPRPDAMKAIASAFHLTASEQDVLEGLLLGQCPKTAAIELGISEHTVRAHLRSIYAKMNARGLVNVIRLSCSFLQS